MSENHKSISINIILCAAALLVGGGGFAGLASLREEPAKREVEEKVFNVEVYEVQKVNLQEIVKGFGSAEAEREVVYSAQVAGGSGVGQPSTESWGGCLWTGVFSQRSGTRNRLQPDRRRRAADDRSGSLSRTAGSGGPRGRRGFGRNADSEAAGRKQHSAPEHGDAGITTSRRKITPAWSGWRKTAR